MIRRTRRILGVLLGLAMVASSHAAGVASGTVTYFTFFTYNGVEGFVVRLTGMSSQPAADA
jgi:hypothetical protein